MDDALEVAPADEFVPAREVLKRVCQVALHVRRQLVLDAHRCVRDLSHVGTHIDSCHFAVITLHALSRHFCSSSLCRF